MNVDEINFLEWGFKTACGAVAAVLWWFMQTLSKAVSANEKDLAAHKLYISETYNTKDEAKTARTETNDLLKELRQDIGDIKTLLMGKQSK